MTIAGRTTHVEARPLIGIGLMLLAMAILPFLDVVAKFLGQQGVPVIQIVWARLFFGALVTCPLAMAVEGRRAFVLQFPGYNLARAIFLMTATGFFFAGLKHMPIADCLAIFFVQPLIVTMLSPLLLGEHVGIRRWLAVIVGFIGTLIIIRPGFQEINIGVFYSLAAGASLALYMILTKKLAGRINAMITTFQTNVIGAVIACVAVLFVWQQPTPEQWFLFVLLAVISNAGHYLAVRAYDYGEASMLAPLAYAEMITAVAAGWWFFGDFPDRWTFIGVAVLIACAIYISYRERVRKVKPIADFEQP